MSVTFSEIELRIRSDVASGDDRVAFNRYWMSLVMGELDRLQSAIRKHRDYRGDDRCWLDDEELYRLLPEGHTAPARDTFVDIHECERFIRCRHNPGTEYVSSQREIERLTAELSAARAHNAALLDMNAADWQKLVEWLKNPDRKPSMFAFTAGLARQAAAAVEQSGILFVCLVALQETERLTAELESTRSLLFDIEVALTNSHPGCHPECDKGVCTHPLKLVRQALAATKPYTTEVT